jgi:D-glycero-D-manno-heptose 1,7-bisphosphate phosphatase
MLQHVVFLDRDGVINRDSPDYVKNWSEFEFLPESIAAIRFLTLSGFTLIVITNQSAIGRKITSAEDVGHIHAMMQECLKAEGCEIKDIFLCPHRPDEGCNCRKPKPGMILSAQQKYRIDLSTAYMVGDNASDIECGRNAGCRYVVLVKSDKTSAVLNILSEKHIVPDHVADNLYEAAKLIVGEVRSEK